MTEETIFAAAREQKTPAELDAYLDRACAGDAALRARVVELLALDQNARSFLEHPAAEQMTLSMGPGHVPPEAAGTIPNHSPDQTIGSRIGPYKILQRIGEGGMGVVYMADQEKPVRRRVALKIIKPGMDSAQVIARFEAERQALAMMDHPGIAHVYDAGTTEMGRPYFAMELVQGIPITEYCDQKQLTPRERLALFVPVCNAIQHAHTKGVIHRDIKPSNILVTTCDGKPVPKVIDFGVAKALNQTLTEKTLFTQFGGVMGTLQYMSPEQTDLDVMGTDARCDVYSLGVLLYELLTGSTPLDARKLREVGYLEMLRTIREQEPPKPSTRLTVSGQELTAVSARRSTEAKKLVRLISGDLDWIVMKCLEKDRARRYETANGLARDLERYLSDEAVEACPPTTGYRLRKMAHKYRAPLRVGAIFALLLVTATVVSVYLAVQAKHAQFEARADENRAVSAEITARLAEASAKEARDIAAAERDKAVAERERADANAMRFGRDLYVADLRLVQQNWEQKAIGRVMELLDGERPEHTIGIDLRGFEWHYWNRLLNTDRLTLKTYGANCAAYSPDGKRVAFGGSNQSLRIVDTATLDTILNFRDLPELAMSPVWCLTFSPDGQRLAVGTGEWGGSTGGSIQFLDTANGKVLLKLKGPSAGVTSLSYSPDGRFLASASGDKTVRIWDTSSGNETFNRTISATVFGVAFSPDGTRLATASDAFPLAGAGGEVKIWDVATQKEIFDFKGHTSRVLSVAFSPDGKRLASGGDDGVKIWDATNGKELRSLAGGGNCVVFSHDGKRILSGDGAVRNWEVSTGKELSPISGPTSGRIMTVAFSPDEESIVSADGWRVRFWNVNGSQEPVSPQTDYNSWYTSTAFSPDGKRLAATGYRYLGFWDPATGKQSQRIENVDWGLVSMAFSPDGTRIATGGADKMIHLLDSTTGKELKLLTGHTTQVNGVAFSPDGIRIASVSGDLHSDLKPEIKVWDATSGKEVLSFTGNSRQVACIAFSPDGKRLAGGITQYTPENSHKDGDFVSGEVQLWDAQTGQPLLRLKHNHHVLSVVFNADGTRIAGSCLSGTTKVWDAQTGKEICTLKGQGGQANGVAFSPDGKRVATVADDGTLRVWDSTTGQEALTLKCLERLLGVAFSPDGTHLAAVGGRTVKIWDASPPQNVVLTVDGRPAREGSHD